MSTVTTPGATITTTGSGTDADPYVLTMANTAVLDRFVGRPFRNVLESLDGPTELVFDLSSSTGLYLTQDMDFRNVTKITFTGTAPSAIGIDLGLMERMRDGLEIVFDSDFAITSSLDQTSPGIILDGDWGENTTFTVEPGAVVPDVQIDGLDPIVDSMTFNFETGSTLTGRVVLENPITDNLDMDVTVNVAPGAEVSPVGAVVLDNAGNLLTGINHQDAMTFTYNYQGASVGNANGLVQGGFELADMRVGNGVIANGVTTYGDLGVSAATVMNLDGATLSGVGHILLTNDDDVLNLGSLDGVGPHINWHVEPASQGVFAGGGLDTDLGAGNDVLNFSGAFTYSVNYLNAVSGTEEYRLLRGVEYGPENVFGMVIYGGEGVGTSDGSTEAEDIQYWNETPVSGDTDVLNFTAVDAEQLEALEQSLQDAGAVQNADGVWVSGNSSNTTIRPFSFLIEGAPTEDYNVWFFDFEQVSLSLENTAPTITVDDAVAVVEAETITISPAALGLDTDDADGNTLTITAVENAPEGVTVTVDPATGEVTLVLSEAFQDALKDGQDAIFDVTFTVDDGNGGTASATSTITIDGVNRTPTVSISDVSVEEAESITITAADFGYDANDEDGEPVTLDRVEFVGDLPEGVSASVVNGTISITLSDALQAQLLTGDSVSFDVTYFVSDDQGSSNATSVASATATVVINGSGEANVAPVIEVLDPTIIEADGVISVPVADLISTTDANNDTVTVSNVVLGTLPDGVMVTTNADGSLNVELSDDLQAALKFDDQRSFEVTYTVSDGQGGEATATATVTIDGINRAPTVTVTDISREEANTITITAADLAFATNDLDGETVSLDIVSFDNVPDGVSIVEVDGNLTVTLTQDFQDSLGVDGTDFFDVTYTVNDGEGAPNSSASATARVTITGANTPPTVSPFLFTTVTEAPEIDITQLVLDTTNDIDGDTVTISAASLVVDFPGLTPTVTDEGNLVLVFSQEFQDIFMNGDTSSFQLNVTVSDGRGGEAQTSILVIINGVGNNEPTITVTPITVDEAPIIDLTAALLATAEDIDEDPLTITSVDADIPAFFADVSLDAEGNVTATLTDAFQSSLNDGQQADIDLTYTVSDGNGGEATATTTLTINGVSETSGSSDGGTGAVEVTQGISLITNGDFSEFAARGRNTLAEGWEGEGASGGLHVSASRAFEGTYHAIGGWTGATGGSIFQTVDTEIGQEYTLSFHAGIGWGGRHFGTLEVTAEGSSGTQQLDSIFSDDHTFRDFYTYTFTAEDTETTLRFKFADGIGDFDIDQVSLVEKVWTDGDDVLSGTAANDSFVSGDGSDTFVFASGATGRDVIVDFSTENDSLDLSDYGVASMQDALALATNTANGTVFTFDSGETVTLADIALATLTEDNFLI